MSRTRSYLEDISPKMIRMSLYVCGFVAPVSHISICINSIWDWGSHFRRLIITSHLLPLVQFDSIQFQFRRQQQETCNWASNNGIVLKYVSESDGAAEVNTLFNTIRLVWDDCLHTFSFFLRWIGLEDKRLTSWLVALSNGLSGVDTQRLIMWSLISQHTCTIWRWKEESKNLSPKSFFWLWLLSSSSQPYQRPSDNDKERKKDDHLKMIARRRINKKSQVSYSVDCLAIECRGWDCTASSLLSWRSNRNFVYLFHNTYYHHSVDLVVRRIWNEKTRI